MDSEFLYVHSCDLNKQFRIRVGSLEGSLSLIDGYKSHVMGGNFFVTLTVYCNERRVGVSVSTSYKPAPSTVRTTLHSWDEWIALPIKINELSLDSFIHTCLWDVSDDLEPRLVAHSSLSMFSKRGLLRSGTIPLKMRMARSNEEAKFPVSPSQFSRQNNVDCLQKLTKEYGENLIEHIDWLDRLTFPRIEKLKKEQELELRCLYLIVQLDKAVLGENNCSVVYYDDDDASRAPTGSCIDPELDLENLCETRHHMMTRNARAGFFERDVKPNATARDALERIIQMPSTQRLSVDDRDLIWKFRYYLRSNRKALAKFVRSVDWDEKEEAKQALQLVYDWSPVDANDALELLSPVFENVELRRYAIDRLSKANQDLILLYLQELVQAIKYERSTREAYAKYKEFIDSKKMDALDNGEDSSKITDCSSGLGKQPCDWIPNPHPPNFLHPSDLASLLLRNACSSFVITNFLYWYFKVECEANAEINPEMSGMYGYLLGLLISALRNGSTNLRRRLFLLHQEHDLIDLMDRLSDMVCQFSGLRHDKETKLRSILQHSEYKNLGGIGLPLAPSVRVTKIEGASVFNSKFTPIRLSFDALDSITYSIIFKRGDDLRQDQLIVQIIRLMDDMMRCDGLDLRLSPYSVLATTPAEGLIQYVKALPMRDVIAIWGSIPEFMRSFRPSPFAPYGIDPEVIDNYVRSCAGYSVICYILGVGDRHLHNLLITESGKMFHVDFGYVLGRDPKPFSPPPMKLTSEMISGMGGTNSKEWKEFRGFCFSAFKILRRHANLILNLFSLMLDSGIPDIAIEKEKAVQKVEQRFHLSLSDELADQMIENLIDQSVSDRINKITDIVHDMHQMMTN